MEMPLFVHLVVIIRCTFPLWGYCELCCCERLHTSHLFLVDVMATPMTCGSFRAAMPDPFNPLYRARGGTHASAVPGAAEVGFSAHCATLGTPVHTFVFVFFAFLGSYLCHIEVPGRGVELKLQLPAYAAATATPHLSPLCDYTTAHGSTGPLTHFSEARHQTRILMDNIWFITAEPQKELPQGLLEKQTVV